MPPVHWHILTGEYPPQAGGVSDYTRIVARGLADAGDSVTVWAPACDAEDEQYPGVVVRRLPDWFGPRTRRLIARDVPRSARLLVQYVPHAFGWKGANVPFCLWLWRRRHHYAIWVMFHEVAYPWGSQYSVAENALSLVTRRMAALAATAARRIFVSIPAWHSLLNRVAHPRAPISWLPIPSGVPDTSDPAEVSRIRLALSPAHPIVGHVGSYGRLVRSMLADAIPGLLATTDCHVLLLGRGGDASRDSLLALHPEWAPRIHAPGAQSAARLSAHVAACDVMLQPYPDGVSTRRTSVMVALAHARPVVTSLGALTEPIWTEAGAVALAPAGQPAALADATAALLGQPGRLAELSARGLALYRSRFDVPQTIAALRAPWPDGAS